MARRAGATMVALLALGALGLMVPWLLDGREASLVTPGPDSAAAHAPIPLAPGQRACMDDVAIDPTSEEARLELRRIRPGQRLGLTVSAPGYRHAAEVRAEPVRDRPSIRTGGGVVVALDPPARAVIGTVCVTNEDERPFVLEGTLSPRVTISRRAVVDGAAVAPAFLLRLREARERSPLAQAPELAQRAAAFSPLGPWAWWLLAALLVLALPALVVRALVGALREDEPTR